MNAARISSRPLTQHLDCEADFLGLDPSMKTPFVASSLFHLALFVFSIVGLPRLLPPPPVVSNPISIEIATIDEITQTNRVAKPVKIEEKKYEPVKKPEKPTPPPMDAAAVPDTAVPPPEEVKKDAMAPAPEKPKKPEPKKDKPAPKKPPVKTPDEAKPKETQQDFDALLKNLTPDTKPETTDEMPEKADEAASAESLIAKLSDRLTISEEDALRRQLASCWNVPSGSRYAEDLVIEVNIIVNRDRTLQSATIVNQGLYNRDPHFRAAADSALRALRNPLCTPLMLPADKYDQWKNTIVVFDPREML